MGLLVPERVDDDTGYCYYSVDQCSTIDMVQQLQNVGVPLAQIKELVDNGAHGLAQLLQQRRDALDEQILELMIARQNATQLLDQCRWVHRDPICDVPIIEHVPVRRIIMFDILYPPAAVLSDDVAAFMRAWELNLRLTKRHMLDRGMPLSLFHHVGCSIDRTHLERREYRLQGSFIFIDEEKVADRYQAGCLPAGDYVTMYKPGYVHEGSRNAEIAGLDALLDYAARHSLTVAGDYYGQIIAETPAFHCPGREMLFKLMLPVHLD